MNKFLKKSLFLFLILFLKSPFTLQGIKKLLPPSPPKTEESSQVNPEEVKNVIDETLQEANVIEKEAKKSTSSLWQKFLSKFENNKMLGALGALGTTAITLMGYALVSARNDAKRERMEKEELANENKKANDEKEKIIDENNKIQKDAAEKIKSLEEKLAEVESRVGQKKTPQFEADLNQPSPKLPRYREEQKKKENIPLVPGGKPVLGDMF